MFFVSKGNPLDFYFNTLYLSDPSVISEPPSNIWDSHRSVSKKCSSRRDLPTSKHKKRKRYRSVSSSFSSSSFSSHRRGNQKDLMGRGDIALPPVNLADYGRYKRSKHPSPLASVVEPISHPDVVSYETQNLPPTDNSVPQ